MPGEGCNESFKDLLTECQSVTDINMRYAGDSNIENEIEKNNNKEDEAGDKEINENSKVELSIDELNEQRNIRCELCKYFYVIGNETHIVHAHEPWPKDVKLFQPYEVEQILLPDNANCLAVQAYLKMCHLDFQIESRANAEFMSPTGKVPFIKCGAFVVAELEGIVSFVAQKGITLTEHLEPDQKADMRAYIALINNVLGNAENYVCWCDKETYSEVTKPRNGSVYPWPLNILQTWSKKSKQVKHLKTLGWYEKSLKEVFQEVETCCQALTDRLEGSIYFFGDRFTELDALLYGHIYTLLTVPIPAGGNGLANLIHKFDKLVDLVSNIDKKVMNRNTIFTVQEWTKVDRCTFFSICKVKDKATRTNTYMKQLIDDLDTTQSVSTSQINTSDDIVTDFSHTHHFDQSGDTRTMQDQAVECQDCPSELFKDLTQDDGIGDIGGKDGDWLLIDENFEIQGLVK
ncbi:metaxin-2 isoform X2 [Onthophagus taurus]